jgi:beta-barrel assembly-enhancing protease
MRHAVCLLTVAALLATPAGAQQSLPDLGGVDSPLSPQMERKIGEAVTREIRFRDPTYIDDAEITDYLDSLGEQLSQAAGARLEFEFFALRDPTINAFALPGGFVGVHTGLITSAESESELASVLAHEVAHVTQHHLARLINQQQQMALPMLAALAAAVLLGRSRPDLTMGAIIGAQGAAAQSGLAYSRDFEREADRVGLQTLGSAGFDTRAMATFFEKMQRSTRLADDSTVPGYLRTHPITSERIADVMNKAASMPYKQHGDAVEFYLVRAKVRADAGDARDTVASLQSAVKEGRYVSEAAARYGLACALARAGKAKEADAELARVRALGVTSPMVELLAARIRQAAPDPAGAAELLTKTRERYPYSRAVNYAYVASLQDAHRNDEAVAALGDMVRKRPRDPRLYAMQAKSYAALGKRLLQHQAQAELYVLQGTLPAAIEQLQLARSAGDGDFYQLSMVDARLKELRAQYSQETKEAQGQR